MTPASAAPPDLAEGPPGSGAVAGGSRGTADAGAEILAAGGSAVDAAIGAMLASTVSEIALTSHGGGGFMLVSDPDGTSVVYDFFSETPGLGGVPDRPAPFIPVTVHYPGAAQTFQVGVASVAVPGTIAGLLHAHRERGRLPLADVVAPAMRYAAEGFPLEPTQADILDLIREILEITPAGREITRHRDGRPRGSGDAIRLPDFAAMLANMASGEITGLASPRLADPLVALMEQSGGLLTGEDLERYRVYNRTPLTLHRNGSDILTNPAPSFGGSILVDAMVNTEQIDGSGAAWAKAIRQLGHATERNRMQDLQRGVPHVSKGTTHVSVVDGDGQMVTLTTSNGSGSGIIWPGTGQFLNNMLGEEDLNPAGFHAMPPGVRIGSMMSPTVVRRADGTRMAMGTGGSERIRSALLAILLRTVDLGQDLDEAVAGPRFHPMPGVVQVEPGCSEELDAALRDEVEVRRWPSPNVFFGGVNAVVRRPDGSVQAVGDSRRGGAAAVVRPQ